MKNYLLLVVACIQFCLVGYSQSDLMNFEKLSLDEGFPSPNMMTVFKDSKGFMWFSTFENLIRFDGNEYKIFYSNSKDSTSLQEGFIHHMFEDSRGRIWSSGGFGIGNFKTVQVYFPSTETFKKIPIETSVPALTQNLHKAQNYIWEDEDSAIWIKSISKCLYKITDKDNGNFQIENFRINESHADSVFAQFVDSKNNFWLGTADGLYLFDRKEEKFLISN